MMNRSVVRLMLAASVALGTGLSHPPRALAANEDCIVDVYPADPVTLYGYGDPPTFFNSFSGTWRPGGPVVSQYWCDVDSRYSVLSRASQMCRDNGWYNSTYGQGYVVADYHPDWYDGSAWHQDDLYEQYDCADLCYIFGDC